MRAVHDNNILIISIKCKPLVLHLHVHAELSNRYLGYRTPIARNALAVFFPKTLIRQLISLSRIVG